MQTAKRYEAARLPVTTTLGWLLAVVAAAAGGYGANRLTERDAQATQLTALVEQVGALVNTVEVLNGRVEKTSDLTQNRFDRIDDKIGDTALELRQAVSANQRQLAVLETRLNAVEQRQAVAAVRQEGGR